MSHQQRGERFARAGACLVLTIATAAFGAPTTPPSPSSPRAVIGADLTTSSMLGLVRSQGTCIFVIAAFSLDLSLARGGTSRTLASQAVGRS